MRFIRDGEKGGMGMEVGEEGDYIPIATLSTMAMQNNCIIIHFPNSQSGSCMAMMMMMS